MEAYWDTSDLIETLTWKPEKASWGRWHLNCGAKFKVLCAGVMEEWRQLARYVGVPIISAPGRLRQEDQQQIKAQFGYITNLNPRLESKRCWPQNQKPT